MGLKIKFINPFGTPIYNDLIAETVRPYARPDTELLVTNTQRCPENIDYYYNKHIVELAVMEDVMRSESEGFDAVIVGCCYDPAVRVCRELVDIPVIGPLEASLQMAPYFGHDYVVVTDHHKAVPALRDLVRLYGSGNCRDVRCINWFVTDMIRDTAGVAQDAQKGVREAQQATGVEAAVLACTIIAASAERWLRENNAPRDRTIVNPNTMALKVAESLAELKSMGAYNIARTGYYEKPQQHDLEEFLRVRERYGQN
jgi:allantoin racemase